MTIDTEETRGSALATVLSEEGFHPIPPRSLEDTNLSAALIESLLLKLLAVVGSSSGRGIAERICLPFGVIESLLQTLRTRQFLTHTGSAPLNDYYYSLTEAGRDRAQVLSKACAYVGPAPVPLADYVNSVGDQTIRAEAPSASSWRERSPIFPSTRACSRALVQRSIRGQGCFCTGRRATANQPWRRE